MSQSSVSGDWKRRLIPGVEAVGAINKLPLSGGETAGYRIEGRPLLTRD